VSSNNDPGSAKIIGMNVKPLTVPSSTSEMARQAKTGARMLTSNIRAMPMVID